MEYDIKSILQRALQIRYFEERLPKHISKIKIERHPMYIQDALFNLNDEQFGYDCFGLLNKLRANPTDYFNFLKLKVKFPNIKLN